MQTWIALLRGVNVGKANRIAMADLRALLADLGYGDVRTLLNSGNAVFTSARKPDPQALEKALADRCGIRSPVVIVRPDELAEALDDDRPPSTGADDSKLIYVFASDPVDPERFADAVATGDVAVGKRHLVIWCPEGAIKSPHAPLANDKGAGTTVTSRNRRTAEKLLALARA